MGTSADHEVVVIGVFTGMIQAEQDVVVGAETFQQGQQFPR